MQLLSMSIFVVLATLATPIFSHKDRFEELFKAEAPIKEVFMELMNLDPATNFKHFQLVLQHMNTKNDKLAPYAKKLISANQKIFDYMLKEINYKKKVDIVKFLNSAFDLMTNPSKKNSETANLIRQLNEYMEKIFEDAMKEAKKNIMEKLLSVVDDVAEGEPPKKQEVVEEKESTKKMNQKTKRSKSTTDTISKDSAESGRKLRRSQLSKVPSNKA